MFDHRRDGGSYASLRCIQYPFFDYRCLPAAAANGAHVIRHSFIESFFIFGKLDKNWMSLPSSKVFVNISSSRPRVDVPDQVQRRKCVLGLNLGTISLRFGMLVLHHIRQLFQRAHGFYKIWIILDNIGLTCYLEIFPRRTNVRRNSRQGILSLDNTFVDFEPPQGILDFGEFLTIQYPEQMEEIFYAKLHRSCSQHHHCSRARGKNSTCLPLLFPRIPHVVGLIHNNHVEIGCDLL